MQTKYITEEKAMETLSKEAGREITSDLMEELASCGVVPAYMVFRPVDKALYPGKRFFLLSSHDTDISSLNGFESPIKALPFPLREDGTFKVSDWAIWGKGKFPTLVTLAYRVFALRADGALDPICDQHFVRRYTQQEVRQSVKRVRLYFDTDDSTEPTPHAFYETFDSYDIEAVGEYRTLSPFTDDPAFTSPTRRTPSTSVAAESSSTRSELLMISALVQIVEEISAARGSRYTKEHIAELMEKRCTVGLSKSSISKYFARASQAWKANSSDARQLYAELGDSPAVQGE